MQTENKNPRNLAIDALRLISILAVVLIHTTTKTFEITGNDLAKTPITLLLNQSARFAVPLFFLISGFVLEMTSHKYTSYWQYFKARVSKILIPYTVWSVIYHYFVYPQNTYDLVGALLRGTASYQLYFIPTLIIFYLLFPLLHQIQAYILNRWALVVLLVVQLVILYSEYFIKPLAIYYPLAVFIFNYFVFILGMTIARKNEKVIAITQKYLIPMVVFLLTGVVYLFFEGKEQYLETGNYLSFYSQWRPSVLIYSLIFFLVMYTTFSLKRLQIRLLIILSELSFFVYFIHIIVMEIVWRGIAKELFFMVYFTFPTGALFEITFLGVVAGISFGVAYLVHRSKTLIKIFG